MKLLMPCIYSKRLICFSFSIYKQDSIVACFIANVKIIMSFTIQLDAEELGIRFGEVSDNAFLYSRELSDRWSYNTTTDNIRDTVLNSMGLSRDDVRNMISIYADTDGSECFAECVADYTTSSSPNQLSINIIQEYSRRLNAVRNGGNNI